MLRVPWDAQPLPVKNVKGFPCRSINATAATFTSGEFCAITFRYRLSIGQAPIWSFATWVSLPEEVPRVAERLKRDEPPHRSHVPGG